MIRDGRQEVGRATRLEQKTHIPYIWPLPICVIVAYGYMSRQKTRARTRVNQEEENGSFGRGIHGQALRTQCQGYNSSWRVNEPASFAGASSDGCRLPPHKAHGVGLRKGQKGEGPLRPRLPRSIPDVMGSTWIGERMRPPPLAGSSPSPEGWRRLHTRLTEGGSEGEKRGGALTTCNLRVSQSVSVAIYISQNCA